MSGKLNTELFIGKAIALHGHAYDYSKSNYTKYHTKLIIGCNGCGLEYETTPANHLAGYGCRKCHGGVALGLQYYIDRANEIHGNLYDYTKAVYKNNRKKVTIICKIHGEFRQTLSNHTHASHPQGCPSCAGVFKYSQEQFLNKCNGIHGDKYDYSQVSLINVDHKISILCRIHGTFDQMAWKHLAGQGCPKCRERVSINEKKWLNHLNITGRQQCIQIKNRRLFLDGFDLATTTAYEFLGDYWHGKPDKFDPNELNPSSKKTYGELYLETMYRIHIMRLAGLNVCYIWESDFLDGKPATMLKAIENKEAK